MWLIDIIKEEHKVLSEDNDRREFLSWKRKNVTIRGVKDRYQSGGNGNGAMLGRGLYTAALANGALSKQYGKVYFVIGGIPDNPKVFNTLNDWEIWFYNKLVVDYSKREGNSYPDKRDFYKYTTIEDEMQKLGYDGIIIKGRELVHYDIDENDVLMFEDEYVLYDYYKYKVKGG